MSNGGKNGRPIGSGVQYNALKSENTVKLTNIITEYYGKREAELVLIEKDPESNMLQKTIAMLILKCRDDVNIQAMTFLIDRMCGKLVEKIDNTSSDGSMSFNFRRKEKND